MTFNNPFANILTEATPAPQVASAPVAAVPAPAPAPSGSANIEGAAPTPANTPAASPGTAPNGVVPTGEPAAAPSPLDQYTDFWQNDPNKAVPGEFKPQPLDPVKLQEVISKADLTSVITPDMMTKINAGGEDAQQAMVQAMNLVSQQTLMQSTTVANKMIEAQVTKALEAMTARIPNLVKEQSLNNSLYDQNPLFKNPAVAPIIEATTAQLRTKYPNATANELTTMAQDYVKAVASGLNPSTTPAPGTVSKADDWTGFEL